LSGKLWAARLRHIIGFELHIRVRWLSVRTAGEEAEGIAEDIDKALPIVG